MDEDEWTDRNFGGNSLVMIEEDNNTSEDSATSLDSDEDDPDDEDSKKPLSAKEARQLQREWLKRIQNGDDDEEISHYDNVKGHRYVIFFSYKQFLFYKHTFLLYDIFGGLDFIFWCILYSNFDFDSHIYFTYYVVAFSRKKDFVSLKMQFIITGSTREHDLFPIARLHYTVHYYLHNLYSATYIYIFLFSLFYLLIM